MTTGTEPRQSGSKLKICSIIGVISMIVIGVLGLIYWKFFMTPEHPQYGYGYGYPPPPPQAAPAEDDYNWPAAADAGYDY